MAESSKGESSAAAAEHKHDEHCMTWRTDLRICRDLCLILDCKVIAKNKTFRAHRAFLQARSSVMASMLQKDQDEIDLREFDQEGVNTLLEYIYTGEVQSLKMSSACEVYMAAIMFQLPLLRRLCVRFMKDKLTVDVMPQVAWLAHNYQEKKLMSRLEWFCAQNLLDVVKSEGWIEFVGWDTRLANAILTAALEINEVKD